MGCVLFDESGRAREIGDTVDGTGFAGVRGHARSHKDLRKPSDFEQDSCSHLDRIGRKPCAVPVWLAGDVAGPIQGGCSHRYSVNSKPAPYLWEITQPSRAALSRSKLGVHDFRSAATLTF